MSERRCLRCKKAPLTEVGTFDPRIKFFECPICRRHYALKPGRQLTFRWLHPISLALYGVQSDESPSARAHEAVDAFTKDRSAEQLQLFVREIMLELEEPTQQVRDILDCRASEGELREFLRSFAEGVEAFLVGRRSGPQNAPNERETREERS
jgi:hypothetical protein